ncbi:UNVERIFIED_CONTAM: hypothetical protein Sindi_1146400 [Sesamum indicum]
MADVKAVDEGSQFPEKRKLDLPNPVNNALEEEKIDADSNKRQKIEIPSGIAAESEGRLNNSAAAEEEDGEEDEDEEDYNAEQDEDGDEETENVDRKGKGIMTDPKGKGKMVEESEDDDSEGDDDDDDDSSDDSDSDFSDGLDESDMEDDPLAEVDLGNILPSRTRQKHVQPGVRIISDPEKGNDA